MRFDDGYGFKIVPVVQLSFLFFADIGFPFFWFDFSLKFTQHCE